MKRFYMPDISDKRLNYTKIGLEELGYISVENEKNAEFIVLGVNPDEKQLSYCLPIFAGNVKSKAVFDYTKNELFALKNAYLTAEAAIGVAINESDLSLINSPALICGYGRIGKALHGYLEAFTKDITVCARNENQRAIAESLGAKAVDFDELQHCEGYFFIFNTVPHPVFSVRELISVNKDALLIDLASFPGGIDKHYAKHFNINYLEARGLPGKFSPKNAGEIVAKTINKIIEEEGL